MVTLWHVLGPRAWLRSTIEREMQMQAVHAPLRNS
jgi:hypothetical protein